MSDQLMLWPITPAAPSQDEQYSHAWTHAVVHPWASISVVCTDRLHKLPALPDHMQAHKCRLGSTREPLNVGCWYNVRRTWSRLAREMHRRGTPLR